MKQLTESQIEARIETMFDAIDTRLMAGEISQEQYDFDAACINAWERSARLTIREYKTWNAWVTGDHIKTTIVAGNAEDARLLYAWRHGMAHDSRITVEGPNR